MEPWAGSDCSDSLGCPVAVGGAVAARVASRVWPAIIYADVLLTEDCNHRCRYCFVRG